VNGCAAAALALALWGAVVGSTQFGNQPPNPEQSAGCEAERFSAQLKKPAKRRRASVLQKIACILR
jgi:hypothetical protein